MILLIQNPNRHEEASKLLNGKYHSAPLSYEAEDSIVSDR